MSYDAPLPGRYNAIIGIESLIHTADPAATIGNLAASLDSGGCLVIVDDMPAEALPTRRRSAARRDFKHAWRCAGRADRGGLDRVSGSIAGLRSDRAA